MLNKTEKVWHVSLCSAVDTLCCASFPNPKAMDILLHNLICNGLTGLYSTMSELVYFFFNGYIIKMELLKYN